MKPGPFFALAAVWMLLPIAPGMSAGGPSSSAEKSTLVSNLGDTVPARAESALQRSGESSSWHGTGAFPKTPAAERDERGTMSTPPPGDGSILGVDRRARVKSTTDYPARATTFIVFTQGSDRLSCSG
jgi:V8-like Glu-specific endopeptidase